MPPDQILQHIFKTEFCQVAMCKVIYRQAGPKVWKYLAGQDARIVHLVRRNDFKAACSYLFQRAVLQGNADHPHPLHHFNREPQKPEPIRLDPQTIVDMCRDRIKARRKALQSLEKYNLQSQAIYYEQMTEGEEIEALPDWLSETLCNFLGVAHFQMSAPYMRRVNAQYPLSDLIANWRQVKLLVKETEFAYYLENEE